jgi:ATPase subunit of ABC transporter with duplicated ATPase domains
MVHFPFVTLDSVTFNLPDGRVLFSDLSHVFDRRCTGIVGRNGIGKSVLARLLAGELQPTSGAIRRPAIHFVRQQVDLNRFRTVAELAHVSDIVAALQRIESGGCAEEDFAIVGDRWDVCLDLHARLAEEGLESLRFDTPTTDLSGGESTRVALIGAFMSAADVLILDEPTNHLDVAQRQRLYECIVQWPGSLIVVSHDRALLRHMECIVELNERGLRSYGGNYDFYFKERTIEQQAAATQLDHARTQRRQWNEEMREQRDRRRHRSAQGKQSARTMNQAPILLGMRQERSQGASRRMESMHAAKTRRIDEQLSSARNNVDPSREVVLLTPHTSVHSGRKILAVEDLVLPFGTASTHPITFRMHGPERLGLFAPNGFGKSTLLKVVAGMLIPMSGLCEVEVPVAYLDQHTVALDVAKSAADNLISRNPRLTESEARTRLALLGLGGEQAMKPTDTLSGGERLIAALAAVLYAEQPTQLLLLDEPTNHLDLVAMEALTNMLNQYGGALIVASHDEDFLRAIRLDGLLTASSEAGIATTAGLVRSPMR